MRDHRRLEAFRLADSLAMRTYEATQRFPAHERFSLTAQLRRSAVSVAANIVEGAARPSEAEYVRFLAVAYGSARELEYELTIALRLGYFEAEAGTALAKLSDRTCRALYGLIRGLRSSNLPRK